MRPSSLLNFHRVCLITVVALVLFCAPRVTLRPSETFRAPGFDGSAFSQRSIFITPVYNGKVFDTSAVISPQRQADVVREAYHDATIADVQEFERAVIARHGANALKGFYEDLGRGNSLAIQTNVKVWQELKADVLLVTRVRDAVAIHSFSGATKRRFQLEAEVWQVEDISLWWRGQVSVSTFDTTKTDADLIWDALLQAFATLPPYRPGMNERDW